MIGSNIKQDIEEIRKIYLYLLLYKEKAHSPAFEWHTLKEYFTMDTLDKTDLQILRTLQENARLTTKELAARVSLSSTPVFERLKRLESGGYIKKYIAVLDAEKLNQGFVVFCSVKLRRLNRDIAAEFTRMIQDIPEVTECYNISGSYDYLLKIHAPNMKYYQEFILNVLGTIDSLGSLESTFVMDEVKHEYGIHI
jgi:Lrp/AsnC family leucine-responsive transcriptional regulator